MALMWPLQHVSRMVVLEPPTGMAQEGREVGGEGMGEAAQAILCVGLNVWFVYAMMVVECWIDREILCWTRRWFIAFVLGCV